MRKITKEIEILEVLEDNPTMTQREIAKRTSFSLGMVNSLIKKCVKTGLLKTEQMTPKTMKYILTPQGIKEKTKKTLRYIKKSYNEIIKLSNKINIIIENSLDKNIYLLGEKDEIFEIAKMTLDSKKVVYEHILNKEDIKKGDVLVLLWDIELENELENEFVNLISK
ncbi:winged helix-turn-helix transcriptional regulator [Haliovirga abyssi]|uniref:Winged helix-turn-helix transcriptional regulator n=1 Tax=Haliovirga abyssi TaxID=2996794 RepID=A0AAU9E0J8_9FUSO|nr:winged helix-turn-helix transcriptional regulator [Haliovirga abyssi]BDU51425.1 hypothetical protein HLVA_19940 [Haliovirga abyssi]